MKIVPLIVAAVITTAACSPILLVETEVETPRVCGWEELPVTRTERFFDVQTQTWVTITTTERVDRRWSCV